MQLLVFCNPPHDHQSPRSYSSAPGERKIQAAPDMVHAARIRFLSESQRQQCLVSNNTRVGWVMPLIVNSGQACITDHAQVLAVSHYWQHPHSYWSFHKTCLMSACSASDARCAVLPSVSACAASSAAVNAAPSSFVPSWLVLF